jgi:predicted NBD/HSP70 family sugar kinase
MTILVVDIGGTSLKFGFSVGGRPLDDLRLFPSNLLCQGDCIDTLAALTHEVIKDAGLAPDLIVSTVPGFIDRDHDRVLFAANLPVLNERRLATEWSQAVHVPVRLERDSILSLMGEGVAGAARGAGSVLGVFFGTGVGAAFIKNNQPFRGGGWALEIGQMPFGNGRRKWDTSRLDCLEAYVSGRVLEIIASAHRVATEEVFEARETNEMLGHDLDGFVEDQATAVVTGVAMFSPEMVVLGGGLCAMRGFPKDRLVHLIEERSRFGHGICRTDVRWASLGWKSVLYGAQLLSSQKE